MPAALGACVSPSTPSHSLRAPNRIAPQEYASPQELWEATRREGDAEGGSKEGPQWYTKAVEYWDAQPASGGCCKGGAGRASRRAGGASSSPGHSPPAIRSAGPATSAHQLGQQAGPSTDVLRALALRRGSCALKEVANILLPILLPTLRTPSCPPHPTDDGVLGGFGQVSKPDIQDSRLFLQKVREGVLTGARSAAAAACLWGTQPNTISSMQPLAGTKRLSGCVPFPSSVRGYETGKASICWAALGDAAAAGGWSGLCFECPQHWAEMSLG